MVNTKIKINVKSVEVQYSFDAGNSFYGGAEKEVCTLNIKSELKFKMGKQKMTKEISNTVYIDNEEMIKVFREEKNHEILKEFVTKKLQPI